MEDAVRQYVPAESVEEQWNLPALEKSVRDEYQLEVPLVDLLKTENNLTDDDIVERVSKAANESYSAKLEQVDKEAFQGFERVVLLQSIDTHWREHLASLDYLRQGIHLRGYAQKNPKQEYKREAFELFRTLLDTIKNEVTRVLMTVRIQTQEQIEQATEAFEEKGQHLENVHYEHEGDTALAEQETEQAIAQASRVKMLPIEEVLPKAGRNDPCPCGSGKKFKHCHGQLA
jgi:preprotein translocase subunit SecA